MTQADFAKLVTGREYLADCQYGSSQNLGARQSIYRYLDQPVDFRSWGLDLIPWSGSERVLDVGCGNGLYLSSLNRDRNVEQLVGLDLSEGMIREVRSRWDHGTRPLLAVADAGHLPMASRSFDVVLAMHMLYHVPDMQRAVSELRRVLRPSGTALVATNSNRHLRQLTALYLDTVVSVAGRSPEADPSSGFRFKLDDRGQELLRGVFGKVDRKDLEGTLRVPDPEAIADYLTSARTHREPFLPSDATWAEVIEQVRRRVEEAIARDGFFEISTHSGVYVCQA